MNNLCANHSTTTAPRSEHNAEVCIRWMGVETMQTKDINTEDAGNISNSVAIAVKDDAKVADNPPRRLHLSASMATEDRMGDLIDASGWTLDAYRKNPVFLWAHQRSIPPIGRSIRTWIENNRLRAIVEFAPTTFAREIAELFENGFMRGVSVGFRPIQLTRRKSADGRNSFHFKQQELLEISAAPVPMHQDALSMCINHPIKTDAQEPDDNFSELQTTINQLWSLARQIEQ